MYINSIKISNFRNYENQYIKFNPHINIIYGNNAQGKTNLLESIYFLALTKSHRSLNDKSLIREGETSTKVEADSIYNNIPTKFEICIKDNKKYYRIDNNNIKSLNEYLSNLKVIIFFPEDLNLIKSSPDIRRRYLNIQITQINKEYFKYLSDYNRLLKIRNDLLKDNLKYNNLDYKYYDIITSYLLDKASYIYCIRNQYIEKINAIISKYYKDISTYENLMILYKTNINIDNYNYNNIKKNLLNKFKEIYSIEIKAGTTLIGPHKDDLIFMLNNQDLKLYGSQGQQRMAILAFKLSEIDIFKVVSGDTPILLLDDVFSELDDSKKNNLLKHIDDNIQTIITTTDLNNLDNKIIENANLIKIENGKIIN